MRFCTSQIRDEVMDDYVIPMNGNFQTEIYLSLP